MLGTRWERGTAPLPGPGAKELGWWVLGQIHRGAVTAGPLAAPLAAPAGKPWKPGHLMGALEQYARGW